MIRDGEVLPIDGPVRMGIPTDVIRGSKQNLSRKWSVAFYEHPAAPDGIIYPSRLNGETNVAVYDRAVPKLREYTSVRLLNAAGMSRVINEFNIDLV